MGTCTCDWLLIIDVPGNTVGQILFRSTVQQLEFHHWVAKIWYHQADILLTLLILGKTSNLCHQETVGSAQNGSYLQTHCEFGCFVHCLGWLLASV